MNKSMMMRIALVAACAILSAQGAVYDETTGYVRLLRNGASVRPLCFMHES